ncbi:glycosyltransferase domain-containing protein [Rossellomorea marisflavi]|uniref:glycosyltransferase domain-containing protein n=1 Tax=Rossellomorea marisflavi TaxID=189381 RepID=UPI0006A9BBE4|nr:glycosyltransferase domain-containing protein [Rossellomorea marisflavi]
MHKNNIVVYTAISQGYDDLSDPSYISEGVDYICFSDNPRLESNIWKIIPFEESKLDNVRKCREAKILPHKFLKQYEYSIWIDGNINVNNDVNELIFDYFKNSGHDLLTFKHPFRDCIYLEAEECIRQKKDKKITIVNQMNNYKNQNFPKHAGLVESNVIVRNHNSSNVIEVMEDWWKEIEHHSRRDQLSFNYVAWKRNFTYGKLEGSSRGGNNYFSLGKHKMKIKDFNKHFINKLRHTFGK